ncbi:aminotransferase [Azorhizobium oxalatiphilum]|uniref:Aminotransferase n=1 Tax=Azorhizobium oxalatiphilum TaxID=980631 RepID=A0A917C445_9HYPH|nr:aspartate aminotransferase family protein [Azorhizobium oxalatiphilum]GGF70851.1 aminotransferase [Azorhizobium oxalatiphilum]
MTSGTQQILALNAFRPDADAAALGGTLEGLISRRTAAFGPGSVVFYRQPLHVVSARGATIQTVDGERFLDLYNNVPSVGHCHPKVVEAVQKQVALLNVHTRYLFDSLDDYAERLCATLPPSLGHLALTCTGSEANDLALRIAGIATGGKGVVVTSAAYHGNTSAVTEVSPSAYKVGAPPDHVQTVAPPDPTYYGPDVAAGFTAAVEGAIAALEARGHKLSCLLVDSIFSSDGVFADPVGLLAGAADAVHRAQGLVIADEVQPGFGRTGTRFWGFARHGITPDIVTMGKPMANGMAMGGVAVRPELLARFSEKFGYFNTFAGNPVAVAAARAVLEVIAEEGLMANADHVGRHLKGRLEDLATRAPALGAVRGAGLYLGVDVVAPDTGLPDPEGASTLINALRHKHILIGAAGRLGHVLKLRPPLCLTVEEADRFVDVLEGLLP